MMDISNHQTLSNNRGDAIFIYMRHNHCDDRLVQNHVRATCPTWVLYQLYRQRKLYTFKLKKHNLINHHVLLFGSERLYTIYYSYSCFCCCSGDVVVVVTVVVLPCQLVLLWEYCVSCWLSPVQCITTNLMRLFHAKFAIHAFNPNELAKSLSLHNICSKYDQYRPW